MNSSCYFVGVVLFSKVVGGFGKYFIGPTVSNFNGFIEKECCSEITHVIGVGPDPVISFAQRIGEFKIAPGNAAH
ncbi:hypothetical protein D3C85_1018740 [compost metagenome]